MRIATGEGVVIQITIEGSNKEVQKEVAGEQVTAWEGFDTESETYPLELDLAMQAWSAVTNARDQRLSVKDQIRTWLESHYQCSEGAKDRISAVANWEKSGGRPTIRGGHNE